ncbi:MAG: dephospho-CoA kinase [Bacteroidota bacterium]
MRKIGITGGIGSGKSLICHLFALNGIPVYSADDAAKNLMQHHEPLKKELIFNFGNIYNEQGELLRNVLAEKVFSNPVELQKVNSIVHPFVIADYNNWEESQKSPYIIRESAILFESGTNKGLDSVITVIAPIELRILRTMIRDHRSREQILSIIEKQTSDEFKIAKSDYTIVNDDKQAVLPQVWKLHSIFVNGKQ